MKISAFTYVRNGLQLDYPFLEAIKSVLPLTDEFIVVIGDSNDGTRAAVEALNDSRIKIIDTIWDDKMRSGGTIFAQQANIGLDHVSKDADWIFHIQADEVIHEKDYPAIKEAMRYYLPKKEIEGLLFKFLNFFGDYKHYAPSRRFHQKEIRIIRNDAHFRSYKDSQGFRAFTNPGDVVHENGRKLRVKEIDATIYHYSYVKSPHKQLEKHLEFGKRWEAEDNWQEGYIAKHKEGFDYNKTIDYLYEFKGTHPELMKPRLAQQDWSFNYNYRVNNMSVKEKLMKLLQDFTGKQFFIYKNYRKV